MHSSRLSAFVAFLAVPSMLLAANVDSRAMSVDVPRPVLNGLQAAGQQLAQSGSMGGTIGNREKSLSGTREAAPERPVKRSKPKKSHRPVAAHHSHGRGGSLDGSWSISSAGINCSDTFRETVVVSGRRMTGNYGGGSVSASGSVSGSGNYNGIGVTSRGRLSGRTGSGTFQRSDGCHGRWTATKQ
jgi:hypothetical protein